MILCPASRKLALTTHIATSVGWAGAVGAFLALTVAGLTSSDPGTLRAAYRAMDVIGWAVIVPLSFASVVTGLVQSLGSPWGLLRHWWVVAKLAMTLLSTGILMGHMQPTGLLSAATTADTFPAVEHSRFRLQLTADAALALAVLVLATGLGVFKPRGLTPYGKRRQRDGDRRS